MSLKYTVKTLDEVPEAQRSLYVEDKEVGFKLAVDGIEDPAELRRAKIRETEARKAAEKQLSELQSQREADAEASRKAADEAAAKAGDVAAIRKSAEERAAKIAADKDAEYAPQLQRYKQNTERLLIDNVASGIASAIAIQGSAMLLVPHLKSRLRVEDRDGEFVTVVVDAAGKPSALTVDDLQKEFAGNPAFAPVIAGTKASGGGAGGASRGGATAKNLPIADFNALSPKDRAAHMAGGGTITE